MKIYTVGGFVRDRFMGVVSKDRDYVVVGSTHDEMIAAGFNKPVGNDFPVYIKNGDEYALARREKKTGEGYHGFETETDNVSLEEDLKRRDITINAIAMEHNDMTLAIDPFNGIDDIRRKVLRHIDKDGFREDPVRVLRIARFLARWPDFSVAAETRALCHQMVKDGELSHLTTERVAKEMLKALSERSPSRFFIFLQSIDALEILFPEVAALYGVPQPFKWHPEGCCFTHTMLVLDQAAKMTDTFQHPMGRLETDEIQSLLNFTALTHDLGKAKTPANILPSHHGHERGGVTIARDMCDRLKLPTLYKQLSMVVCEYHSHVHNVFDLKSKTLAHMFKDNRNIFGNDQLLWIFVMTSMADAKGRGPFYEHVPYPNSECMERIMISVGKVVARELMPEAELKDPKNINKIIQKVFRARMDAATVARNTFTFAM